MGALHALLLALFTGEEFRRWLRLGPFAGIVPELPGEAASPAAFVEAALGSLERRNLIDSSFFALLTQERQQRRDDIASVAGLWPMSARETGREPPPQPTRRVEDPVIIAPELFFRPWLDPRPGHHHCWTLVGREALCGELIATITAEQRRVLLLEGRGGIGKSRLVLELAGRLQKQGLPVFAYQEGGAVTGEHLGELPGERAVLLLDDAHRIDPEDLTRIVEFTAKQRPRLTLVFACRPYGVEPITRACSVAGLGFDTQTRCEIPNLSEEARIALAAESLGPGHDSTLLARAFPDAPLFITVGGSLLRTGGLSLEQLRRSDDLRRLVLEHFPYKPLLRDCSTPDSHMHAVLGIAALLTSLSTRDRPLVEQLSGLEPLAATRATELLFDLGILEDVNGVLRILPDLYGSHATLAWAVPRGVSAGRVHALWQRLHETRLRYALLRNLLELMREVASAVQRAALRVELAEIWARCVQARGTADSLDEHYNDRYLELMASELASQALELAERLARAPRRNAESELCVALTRAALRASVDPDDPLRSRGIDLLVHLARDAQEGRDRQLLREFARDRHFAEDVGAAVEQALVRGPSSLEFVTTAIDALSTAFQVTLNAAEEGHRVPALLSWHRQLGLRLVALALAHPPPNLSFALWSLVRTFIVAWDQWAQARPEHLEACRASTLVLLDALERGLVACGDVGRAFTARRALREGVGAVDPALVGPLCVLIRRCGDFDLVFDALDPSFVPLDVLEARARERVQDVYSAAVEGIRGRAMQRLLEQAPDLAGMPEPEPHLELLCRCLAEDSLLVSPAYLVRGSDLWVEVTIENQLGSGALLQALTHRFPDQPELEPGLLRSYYEATRFDELYALAVIRHSEATGAIVAAHVLMLVDLRRLFLCAREAARRLLSTIERPDELWGFLHQIAATLSTSGTPRYYALLYALVLECPTVAEPLVRSIIGADLAGPDTIAPIVQALRHHDAEAARSLVASLLAAGMAVAEAGALVLPSWVARTDERALLRVALDHPDPRVLTHAFTAAGVLFAMRPQDGREFVEGPRAPRNVAELRAWMDGFTTAQTVFAYLPASCQHIDALLAPVARSFARRAVHPRGALDLEMGAERVATRIARIIAGIEPPAWHALPPEVVNRLIHATVELDSLADRASENFLVACAQRWPQATFASLLDALTSSPGRAKTPRELIEAMIRPLADTEHLTDVARLLLARARYEREGDPAGTVTSSVVAGSLGRLSRPLLALCDASDDEEETLLDVAHLLRTIDLVQLLNHPEFVLRPCERYAERSPTYRRRLTQLFARIDREPIEREIEHWNPSRMQPLIGAVARIRAELREPSPAQWLYGRVDELLGGRMQRLRRAAEA